MFVAGIGLTMFSAFSGENAKYPGGSPGGYTGSPGDGKNCTQCHGGASALVTNWITSDVPATGYVPGSVYNITVTVTGSGKKGFEVSPQTPAGALVGTLTAGTTSKLVNSNKALTQKSAINTATAVWTFQWTAPAAGTGPVTFYGAFTVAKSVTKLSTTIIPESTTGIDEHLSGGITIYPNPSHGQVSIQGDFLGITDFCLYAANGSKINMDIENVLNAGTKNVIELPVLAKGLYLLSYKVNGQIRSKKIIIE